MISEREADKEFVNWFERWREELKSRVLGELIPREEGQPQAPAGQEPEFQDLADTASARRNDGERELSVIPGPTSQPMILLHTNVSNSSETTGNPTKAV